MEMSLSPVPLASLLSVQCVDVCAGSVRQLCWSWAKGLHHWHHEIGAFQSSCSFGHCCHHGHSVAAIVNGGKGMCKLLYGGLKCFEVEVQWRDEIQWVGAEGQLFVCGCEDCFHCHHVVIVSMVGEICCQGFHCMDLCQKSVNVDAQWWYKVAETCFG